MRVAVRDDRLAVGGRLRITFQRTLRIPDDGRSHPLPPGLGVFPIVATSDYANRVPEHWRGENAFLIPMYQREALWIGFDNDWPPVAVRVAVGNVCAVSGRVVGDDLSAEPQGYVVCPEQLWLDGINAGPGMVRQFVAMPLGEGYTVESAVRGDDRHAGIQIRVWAPKPGLVLERPPQRATARPSRRPASPAMGLGAGGQITQKIYPDPYGVHTWDGRSVGTAVVHIVNSLAYREITGTDPPPTPIDASTYTAHGLPWFELYEEHQADVPAPGALTGAKTIAQRDRELGLAPDDQHLDLEKTPVTKLHPRAIRRSH
jgi:hypothetical protein